MVDMTIPPLEAEIRRRIALAGPMPVRQFMALCLAHPQHGYYMTRDPLGRAGDFVTAPEVSQIFGELVGLWAASAWQLMGAPENVRLVELGPGRGTMMLDAMRAANVVPAFRNALVVHLIEISPELRRRQQAALKGLGVPMLWHDSFDQVPDGPVIVIANEFFDALPVHQAIKQINGWYERMVAIDSEGNFAFSIADEPIPLFDQLVPQQVRDAPLGSTFEWRPDNLALEIGRRIMREGGAALVIDYGHTESAPGETLQAVGRHGFADPLGMPGTVDLTAHVDFQALKLAAETMGVRTHGPLDQAEFLRRMGVERRANALKSQTTKDKALDIDVAVARLTGEGRTGMGKLFKAIAFSDPKIAALPGFVR
jgi:NADH dehydrogenase [ubiquinone] 1 alpha subcomplex assembly factor 7